MNRAKVVILDTIEAQFAAGDRDLILPSGVKLPQDNPVICFIGFNYRVPDDIAGMVYDIRLEDGRIVGDLELDEKFKSLVERGVKVFADPKMGIGVLVDEQAQIAKKTSFVSVGLLEPQR